MENVTLEMIYSEIKQVNQRVAVLEHLFIQEEKLNHEELKELDEAIKDVKNSKLKISGLSVKRNS